MVNSSDTFKTGERVLADGEYACLLCGQAGKVTTKSLAKGAIFPFCDGCDTKDATFRLSARPART